MSSTIAPRRAAHLRPGDVVKLHPLDRRRVLSVAPVDGAPVFMAGTWEVLTFSRPRVETFKTPFARFFTIERN